MVTCEPSARLKNARNVLEINACTSEGLFRTLSRFGSFGFVTSMSWQPARPTASAPRSSVFIVRMIRYLRALEDDLDAGCERAVTREVEVVGAREGIVRA